MASPVVVAVTLTLLTALGFIGLICTTYAPHLLAEFQTPNACGISLAVMATLVHVAMECYLAAHILVGLWPATAAPRTRQWTLIVALVLMETVRLVRPA